METPKEFVKHVNDGYGWITVEQAYLSFPTTFTYEEEEETFRILADRGMLYDEIPYEITDGSKPPKEFQRTI